MGLKYIKLFEAFQSRKLTSILDYLNEKSKPKFTNFIMYLGKNLDFPPSELTDDLFQIKKWEEAIQIKPENSITINCKARSVDIFLAKGKDLQPHRGHLPSTETAGIEGEYCEGGRIYRRWGTGRRKVQCPVCLGSGVITQRNNSGVLYKFWIDHQGNLEGITRNGHIRNFIYSASTSCSYTFKGVHFYAPYHQIWQEDNSFFISYSPEKEFEKIVDKSAFALILDERALLELNMDKWSEIIQKREELKAAAAQTKPDYKKMYSFELSKLTEEKFIEYVDRVLSDVERGDYSKVKRFILNLFGGDLFGIVFCMDRTMYPGFIQGYFLEGDRDKLKLSYSIIKRKRNSILDGLKFLGEDKEKFGDIAEQLVEFNKNINKCLDGVSIENEQDLVDLFKKLNNLNYNCILYLRGKFASLDIDPIISKKYILSEDKFHELWINWAESIKQNPTILQDYEAKIKTILE